MEQQPIPAWVKRAAEFLKTHKYVKTIYLNEKGEYHLHAVKGFTAVDAAEFLNDYEVYGANKTEEIVLPVVPDEPAEPEPVETSNEETTVNNPGETIQF